SVETVTGFVSEDQAQGLFRVARTAFTEDAVFKAEYEAVFNKCWLYVGHESEVAKNGDFVRRNIAGRNLVLNRDTSGNLNVFFNVCPHRGAEVCREKHGNAKHFQCFYHGWIFGSDGKLKSQPGKERYTANFEEQTR